MKAVFVLLAALCACTLASVPYYNGVVSGYGGVLGRGLGGYGNYGSYGVGPAYVNGYGALGLGNGYGNYGAYGVRGYGYRGGPGYVY